MNKKGISPSIIVAICFLFISLIVVFLILNYSKSLRKANVNKNSNATHEAITTTLNVDNKDDNSNNLDNRDNDEDKIKNFNTTFSNIIENRIPYEDYAYEIKYNGIIFNVNCTNYDKDNKVCKEGSALMNLGNNILIPLYTYKNDSDNYMLKSNKLYIIVNDNNIILSYEKNIKIYDRNGKFLSDINNTITEYDFYGDNIEELYPMIDSDNNINYYICNNGVASLVTANINTSNNILYSQVIDGSKCN